MVDIHSHVLWGLDDGAATSDDSLAMLRLAAQTGTTDIVATPHANLEFPYRPGLIAERIQQLQSAVGASLRIHRGCEFHLRLENIQSALAGHRDYTVNGGRYLIVELPEFFLSPPMDEVLRQLVARGVVPVVTHPERNPTLQDSPEILERWIGQGCLAQVTAQSITGELGRAAKDAAWSLLRRGFVHFVASDAHDAVHRPPRLDLARQVLEREFGPEVAALLFLHNPQAVIQDLPLDPGPFPLSPKKPAAFWRRFTRGAA
jgi:protein-tyrosine phosphatase